MHLLVCHICAPVYINATTTGQTSVKFDIRGLLLKSVQKIHIWLEPCTLYEDSLIIAGDIKLL